MQSKFSYLILVIAAALVSFCGPQPETNQQTTDTGTAKEADKKIVPVEVQIVKKAVHQQSVSISGLIQARHKVDLVAETSGKVKKIFKELGQSVTTSDTLAIIDDEVPHSQYRQAQAQVLSAKNNLEIAQLNLASDRLLFNSKDISKLALQNSELAVKNARAGLLSAQSALTIARKGYLDTRITSPFSGRIARSYLDLGQMVQPGQPLYQVVDLSRLVIQIGLPQDIIGQVFRGTPAEVRISALNGKTFKGRVEFISPQADEASGTFTAEVHLENPTGSGIRAGMTAEITLYLNSPEAVISVPSEAVIRYDGSADIYKVINGRALAIAVEVNNSHGARTIVTSGLNVGDTIVVVGQKLLGANTAVHIEKIQ